MFGIVEKNAVRTGPVPGDLRRTWVCASDIELNEEGHPESGTEKRI